MQAHVELGRFSELPIKEDTAAGVYLDSDAGNILLPRKYVPEGAMAGDIIRVFVYRDSDDRLVATTLKPAAIVGECAWLKVVALSRAGAFLDWGIQKDLLVPYSEQSVKMEVGQKYIVRIFLDERTQRIAATTKIGKFMEKDNTGLREAESVSLLIYRFTDYGIKVIINDRWFGLLYENEVFEKLHIGDKVMGYIRKIRPDGKIDLALGKTGMEGIEEAKAVILKALKEHRGFLPMGDFSAPEHIRENLHMSKKTFKKAVGGLYKNELIEIKEDGIRLKRVDKVKMVHRFKF